MRTGVVIRPWDGPNVVDDAVAGARAAVDAGVRRVWFGQLFAEDAVALAGLVAREVPEVEVGVAAIPVFGRHPVVVGSAARTAQAAARGRFRLGLALGAPDLVEAAFGEPYRRPVARLEEFLHALVPMLATGTTDHRGDLITATTPVPGVVAGAEPRPPVYVGAMGPRALQVAGALADGVLPRLAGPRVLAERIVPTVTAAAREVGRPAPEVLLNVPVAVTAEPDRVRGTITDFLAFFETIPSYRRILDEEGVDRAGDLAILGEEDAVAAALQRHVDAGATELIVETDGLDPADRERTWRLLGRLES